MLYLRFAGFDRDERTLCSVGMFQIAYGLLQSELDSYVREEVRCCIRWLEENLVPPSRLYRPGRRRYAISWFQPSARPEIAMARRLVTTIEEAGVPMRSLRTATPGYVVYRDLKQVVAVPFQTC